MKKFQYITFQQSLSETDLNSLGKEGWELVTHTVAINNTAIGAIRWAQYYVFKREI